MRSARASAGRDDRLDARLGLSALTPAVAWISAFMVNVLLSPWVCATGERWVVPAVTLVASLAAIAGGIASWRTWKELPGEEGEGDDPTGARRRFMAAGGILLSVVFLIAILALAIPGVVHRPCD
ncbi:MAG TPA: hypothetical protein VIY96_11770 [Thermoanaerobaculia bacterium]